MIRKIKRRFILAAAVAVVIVLGTVIAIINGAMRGVLAYQTGQTLNGLLSWMEEESASQEYRPGAGLMLGSHYFLARISRDEEEIRIDLSHEVMVDETEARMLVRENLSGGSSAGTVCVEDEEFAWRSRETDGTVLMAFLNTTASRNTMKALLMFSIMIGLFSWVGFLIIFIRLSDRATAPVVKSMEAQKRFITNASHELKTPIAIISANTELQEAVNGENEWTRSTMAQTERLTGLINELVTLSRISEMEKPEFTETDFSGIVRRSCTAILPVAERQHKRLETEIREHVTVNGEPRLLEMLVNIFLDNAAKYCDPGGLIRAELKTRLRENGAVLLVSNDYADGENVDYSRFFERFYQEEESHNSKKSGFGIGLSTAQEIVGLHGGSIKTEYESGRICFRIMLPGGKKAKKPSENAENT